MGNPSSPDLKADYRIKVPHYARYIESVSAIGQLHVSKIVTQIDRRMYFSGEIVHAIRGDCPRGNVGQGLNEEQNSNFGLYCAMKIICLNVYLHEVLCITAPLPFTCKIYFCTELLANVISQEDTQTHKRIN